MSKSWYDARLLLARGAGITRRNGELYTDNSFNPRERKATPAANQLMADLAARVQAAELRPSYIAVFEDRPAVRALALILAKKLSLDGREVGVLSVKRTSSRGLVFRLYRDSQSYTAISRLSSTEATELLAGRRVLFFTDILRGDRQEGILHMMFAPATRRLGVKRVGLVAVVVREVGYSQLFKRLEGSERRRPPILLYYHHNVHPVGSELSPTAARTAWWEKIFLQLTSRYRSLRTSR